MSSSAEATRQRALIAALRGRCPRCGEGALFAGLLKIAPVCSQCGLGLGAIEAGDGPAVFIVLIVGAIVVPLALVTEVVAQPPLWARALLWTPLVVGLSVALMRPFRAMLVALHWANGASNE